MNLRLNAQSRMTSVVALSKQVTKQSLDKVSKLKASLLGNDLSIDAVRIWVISLFVRALKTCSVEKDRLDAVAWLAITREIIGSEGLSTASKAKKVYELTGTRRLATSIFRGVGQAYKSYKQSDMSLALKVAIPVTLSAGAVIGGSSVGLAGFGSAIGVPVLLLVFLGAAGITSVLEGILSSAEARNYLSVVAYMIAQDEILRRCSQTLRRAMVDEMAAPQRQSSGSSEAELTASLLAMNPYDFERHTMSFFQDAGMLAWVTKKSNDAGVDGFVRHANGIVVVQCKRNAEDNRVGRPVVQQFKGVIEEQNAWRGYIVSTSTFTREAAESAGKNDRVILVDIGELIKWHREGMDTSLMQ